MNSIAQNFYIDGGVILNPSTGNIFQNFSFGTKSVDLTSKLCDMKDVFLFLKRTLLF